MDIRTKLALAFVSVSLLSMFLLGAFAYRVSSDLLQEISERQLDALAESKKQDLENVIESWRDHVRLIRSRTQLRLNMQEYQQGGSDSVLAETKRIAEDAQESIEHVERITLFDLDGRNMISSGAAERAAAPVSDLEPDEIRYSGFFIARDGKPKAVFASRVTLDQKSIGNVEVVIGMDDVERVAGNHRGLGETGETMIFGQSEKGELVLLHALRHADTAPDWAAAPGYIRAAIAGQERLITESAKDYRNSDVWAATRYLPDVSWGLVQKVDVDEEMMRVRGLRGDLIDLGLALGAFAVAGGTLLGFYLARPIRELAQVVRRVREGEKSLRADVSLDDEIGSLAEALNEYLDHIHNNRDSTDR